MTDQEFVELQKELAAKIAEVERLQRIYEGQTGRRFVAAVRVQKKEEAGEADL